MTFQHTLQFRLTVQWVCVMSLLLGLLSLAIYLGLRAILYRNLDGTLWAIAENELASAFDGPTGTLHFHETGSDAFLPNDVPRLDKLVQYRTFPQGVLLAKSRHLGVLELPLHPAAQVQVTQGKVALETVSMASMAPLRLLSRACRTREPRECLIQVGASLAPIQTTMQGLLTLLVALDGSALILTALGGAFLARRALRPVTHVVQAVEQIESQHLHQRLPVIQPLDEIGRLMVVLNRMLDRLERSFHTQQRFIADASHELRSPLANLRLELELALRGSAR